MTEREKLMELIEKVKNRIRALDEIESHLLDMQDLVTKSTEDDLLDDERCTIQTEIDELIAEIGFIDMKTRIREDRTWT